MARWEVLEELLHAELSPSGGGWEALGGDRSRCCAPITQRGALGGAPDAGDSQVWSKATTHDPYPPLSCSQYITCLLRVSSLGHDFF